MFRNGIGIFAQLATISAINYQKKNNEFNIIKYQQPKVTIPKYKFALNQQEKYMIKQFQAEQISPTIVALYDKRDGTTYADLAIEYFQEKGFKVVMVSSDEGYNHAIFSQQNIINGIYLPGGPNIPVGNTQDPRKVFETQLSNLAIQQDIPLLGICRGQQTLGHYYGFDVQDLKDFDLHYAHGHHQDEEIFNKTQNPSLNNRVVVESGSQLHQALQHKLNEGSNGECIEFHTTCLHEQHIVNDSENMNLSVVARSKYDNTVENVEISTGNYYMIGIQHHPESVIDSYVAMRQEKISRINSEFDQALRELHYADAEIHIGLEFSNTLRKVRVALEKPRDEKVARAELGLFTNQVKKHFLDRPVEGQQNKRRF